ncbi:hypothetical protein FB45DRAFT_892081 [Roridomyces roridus]|uniref:Uncharacterized protein n=1 Tax=Roridomyces roridus TaxID=1738132 RepID=A0AAD7CEP5_9AGAR|nr:hypothetical protein FB45DRAFT_892081 [Roridomyces roridus]
MDLLDSNLLPGPTFFPTLLAHVRELAPASLPLDAVVFQSVLRCLIAGEKHLLLRAREEDVRLVVKLAFLTLSSVFGLPTHKLKIRPRSASSAESGAPFLRSLFLPWSASVDSQDEGPLPKRNANRTRNNATWARSSSRNPRRSMSNPNELQGGTTRSNPFGDSHQYVPSSGSSATNLNPFRTAPKAPRGRAPLPHAFSDPTPLRSKLDALALQPCALVISGLENATMPSQRALSTVLAERRVVLDDEDGDEVWNLPDGFIMIYVCPMDAHERPAIHKTLLDKFAMSVAVSPHQTTRSLLAASARNSGSYRGSPALHSPPLPVTPTSTPPFLTQPLPPHGHRYSYHHLQEPPLVSPELLQQLRRSFHRTHISPALNIYACDLFSAARHHPQLDATLLTAKTIRDAVELARAGRVIGGDLTGMELVRDDATFLANHGNSPTKNVGDHDDDSPLAAPGNGHAHRYQPIEVVVEETDSASTPVQTTEHQMRRAWDAVLEVSEADIARIVPRVMTHRVRVRDGPQSEILGSAMFPAVGDDREEMPAGIARTTIKEILVRILAEV